MTFGWLTLEQAATAVVRRLREHGHEAFWAGGCVRDRLLGLAPTDMDIATDAPPDRVVELFTRTRKVGVQFGVVLVRQGPHWLEVATFRTDMEYRDGRRPEQVVFTNAREDALRRDFTINGLFYDPLEDRVIDYVDGRRDLEARIVRAIGDPDARFAEDHLRVLRAVRFAARFSFTLDPATAEAARRYAASLSRISAERIREELERMLTHASRAEAFRMAGELGLLEHLWPEATWSAEQIRRAVATLAALPEDCDSVTGLAGLLADRPAPECRRIAAALRLSNRATSDLLWVVEHVDAVEQAEILCRPAFKKLLAHPRFDSLLAVHRAVCVARGLSVAANDHARQRRDRIPAAEVAPPPLVTGDDLIAMGLRPGPPFRKILDTLYDEQLDDRLRTREEALARARAWLAAGGPFRGHHHEDASGASGPPDRPGGDRP